MRIAMLSWESLHSIQVGGMSAHVTELAAALARKGHEVHVFTRMAHGQPQYDRIDGVHYQRCPYPGHHDFVDDVNNMCRAMVARVFAVEDAAGPFDVVHAHDWLTANAMIWIKQGRGRRSVLTIHATEYARCGNTFPGGRSHRVRTQERAGTYWADRVIAVSQATKTELMWMYEVPDAKAFVVYNGVSPRRFNDNLDAGEVKRRYAIGPMDPTILYCGRLEWQKGPDLLVEAVPAILRSHPRAKFVFAGDGGMRGPLENRARQLGVADAVRFLGFRNGGELVALFKMADGICVPSRNEPFGIVVLEAWAAGKPVVVTQNGGPGEYVWHEVNGLKIYPHTGSVIWGIQRLFSDFERARWMGRNGRIAVGQRFTWDLITQQTLGVYEPAAAATAAPRPEKDAEVKPAAARAEAAPAIPVGVREEAPAAAAAKAAPAFVETVAAVVMAAPAFVETVAALAETAPAKEEPVAAAAAKTAPMHEAAAAAPVEAVAAAAHTAPSDKGAAEPPLRLRAKLAFAPDGHPGLFAEAFAACKKALAEAKSICLRVRRGNFIVEGDAEAVWTAVRQCYEAVRRLGAPHFETSINVAGPNGESRPMEADLRGGMVDPRIVEGRRTPLLRVVVAGLKPRRQAQRLAEGVALQAGA
jgi:glycosyltransferase involved in cell wall biosynthesis/uncharacterized protein YqgV (UPF0045/DUF77 family)